ncbi:MAG TPA: methionyl-tRNA formyltransferase, partial [Roseiarcus sp.]|nr:methionyl-tRNA formyltransferase [Roseiarcus sp.]
EQATVVFRPQDTVGVTYAPKIEKQEAQIDWRVDSETVRNQVHGLSPAPGAFSYIVLRDRPERLKLFRAEAVAGCGVPGTILDDEMTVACGRGAIKVIEVQRGGGVVLSGDELMRRERLSRGKTFAPAHAFSSGSLEPP